MLQHEYFGVGSLQHLRPILEQEKASTVFLVTGKKSYEASGAKAKISPLLAGLNVVHFSDFESNPKIEDIQKGVVLFKQCNPDLVIAVGGGSAIDVAKSINVLAAQGRDDFVQMTKEKVFKKKGKTLVAIPTTSGTGSEATHYAVVYIDQIKHSIEPDFNLPDYAIIDPSLTFNLDPKITACTGMDALAQAIESYWCVHSTDESKALSREAILLIWGNLEEAVLKSTQKSRIAMSRGSNLAGKAIAITRTTAPHAVSYPLTAHFGIPHGHAVGLTLGAMLIFNSQVTDQDCLDKRGSAYVQKNIDELVELLGAKTPEVASQALYNLMEQISLPAHLSALGIQKKDFDLIVTEGFNPERVKNNPRELTEKALRTMLHELFSPLFHYMNDLGHFRPIQGSF